MSSEFNAYDKYMDMTTTLKKLIEEGKDESAEEEALRDAMDDVWFLMTPEEIKRFNPDNEEKTMTMSKAEVISALEELKKTVDKAGSEKSRVQPRKGD